MPEETFTNNNPESSTKFESGKSHAKRAAEDLRSAAEFKAQELRGIAEQRFDEARDKARTLREDGEQYVRENPSRAVLTALGIGFVLGMIFRR